jgi:CheY-like chemotaxis protein
MNNILIVEDAQNYRDWLREGLQRTWPEVTVRVVEDQQAAEVALEVQPPDILLLDLGLPRDAHDPEARPQAGLALLRQAQRLDPPPRVAVITNYALDRECQDLGAEVVLHKGSPGLWPEVRAQVQGWMEEESEERGRMKG